MHAYLPADALRVLVNTSVLVAASAGYARQALSGPLLGEARQPGWRGFTFAAEEPAYAPIKGGERARRTACAATPLLTAALSR